MSCSARVMSRREGQFVVEQSNVFSAHSSHEPLVIHVRLPSPMIVEREHQWPDFMHINYSLLTMMRIIEIVSTPVIHKLYICQGIASRMKLPTSNCR